MNKFILIIACVMIIQAGTSQPVPEKSPQKIKVLSWNIYMLPGVLAKLNGKRASMIGKLLASSDYDVVVFQEAFCQLARRKISRELDSVFSYQAGPANRKLFSIRTNSGIWIVSRFPILSHQSIVFKNRHGADAFSRKGALMVELQINGNKIQVVGTHLQNSGSPWLRLAQCIELSERLLKPNRKAGVPQIVCGDFNIDKNAAVENYRTMLTSLNATDGPLQGTHQFSYDRLNNDLQVEKGQGQNLIDYILVQENGAAVTCTYRQIKVIRQQWNSLHADLSDHYSMEAEFTFSDYPHMISVR